MRWRRLYTRCTALARRARIQLADDHDRAELLRRQGAHVGEGCQLISKDLGTSPWLVSIGDHTCVSGDVLFLSHDAATWAIGEKRPTCHIDRIYIGSWCFVGARSIILPGTRIGDHCVVGAGSIVKGTFPDRVVIAGNPARIIKSLDDFAEAAWRRGLKLTATTRKGVRRELEELLPYEP